jgi:hypothetical protein
VLQGAEVAAAQQIGLRVLEGAFHFAFGLHCQVHPI